MSHQPINMPDDIAIDLWLQSMNDELNELLARDGRDDVTDMLQQRYSILKRLAIASVKREPLIDAKIHSILWDAHPVCCGNLEDDGEWYMGMREPAHCCGCPDHDMLSDADIVKALRNLIPEQAHGITATTASKGDGDGR